MNTWETIYTVPAGHVAIVKTLTWHTGDGSDIDGIFGAQLSSVDGFVLYRGTIHTSDNPVVEINHVLEEGDSLEIFLNTGAGDHPIGFYVSGSVLSSP